MFARLFLREGCAAQCRYMRATLCTWLRGYRGRLRRALIRPHPLFSYCRARCFAQHSARVVVVSTSKPKWRTNTARRCMQCGRAHTQAPKAPHISNPAQSELLDIRPGVSFRRLCGVRPAHGRRFRSAFDSRGPCAELVQYSAGHA